MNQDEYRDVRIYCMFLGYPRSGHSLVGALLNAHQEVVMAHELDALSHIKQGISRDQLFQKILDADKSFVQTGAQWKEYSYKVPNQWQGKYNKLQIIGDKKGGRSALLLQNEPQLLDKLESVVGVPVYIIHVVRNPFDNIATMSHKNRLTLSQSIENHLGRCRFIDQFSGFFPDSRFITIHHEDIIENPAEEIVRLCRFLGIEAGQPYLNDCSSIVFKSPSKTRNTVQWNQDMIESVEQAICDIPFLKKYTFKN